MFKLEMQLTDILSMNISKALIASALTLTIFGCGGNSTSTQATSSSAPAVTLFGSVWLDNETYASQSTATYAYASFERSAEPINPRFFELYNVFNSAPQTEGCDITDLNTQLGAASGEQAVAVFEELVALAPRGDAIETVSAGEFVNIMTPEGSWPAMFQDPMGYEGYQTGREEYKPGAIGSGSTVTFSGAEFPAMSDIPLATVAPILDLATSTPSVHSLKTGDSVTWQSNSSRPDDYAVLNFYIGKLELAERPSSFTAMQRLRCTVADTGHFDLPPALNTMLSDQNYAVGGIAMTRQHLTTYQQGEAILSLGATSEAELEVFSYP